MPDPRTFPMILMATSFVAVLIAVVIAIMVESVGFRRRYRLRRQGQGDRPRPGLTTPSGALVRSGARSGPLLG